MWGGRKTLTETTLWTNSSPTSSFAAQTVTLSDNISNYDYIAFDFRPSTSDSTSHRVIYPVSEIQAWATAASDNNKALGAFSSRISSTQKRLIYYGGAANKINFDIATSMWGSTSNNAYIIPTYIRGIKV